MEKSTTDSTTRESDFSPIASTEPAIAIEKLTLWQVVSKWRKVVFYCLALSSAIVLYGYDQAIVGSVSGLPAFQRDFGQKLGTKMILPSLWLGLWNVGTPIGVMVGGVFAGWEQDKFGRRFSLALASIVAAAGIAVMFSCFAADDVLTRRGLFLAGKIVQGVGIGMIMATTQTYMSEVLPPLLRGPILSFLTIWTIIGQLIGAIVVFTSINQPGKKSYTICFGSQWPFCILTIVVAYFLPESPSYLIRKGKSDQAYRAQDRLNEPGAHNASVIERLRISIEEETQNSKSNYTDCFRGNNLRRTLIIIFACILPQTFGLTLLAKASYFLQVVGMAARPSIFMVIVGLVLGLLSNGASFWTLSRFGRRTLILFTLSIISIMWFSVGVGGCFSGLPTVWYTAAGMMVVTVLFGVGVWPASCVVASEVSALHLRAKAQGIAWFTNGAAAGIMGFVLPYIFNPDQGNLKAKTGFVYGAFSGIAVVVAWFIIPEMKGRDWVAIDRMFEEKVAARDFKQYREPGIVGRDV